MSEFVVQNLQLSDQRSAGRWLLSHLSRHWLLALAMFFGAFGNAALAAVAPIMIGIAFDAALLTPPDTRAIGLAALGIVVSQLVRAGLQFGRNFSSAVVGERLERDIRREIYVSLLGKSTAFHDAWQVGDIMARATNDVREINLMVATGLNLVIGSAWFMVMPLLLAPRISPLLTLPPLFYIVSYIVVVRRYLRELSLVADRVREGFGGLNTRLAEAIDGVELIKGSAQEAGETAKFTGDVREYRDAAVAQGRTEARFLPLLLLGLTQALGFSAALLLFNAGQIALGEVIAYMGLLGLFFFPTFISLMAYSRVSLGLASARRILEMLHTRSDLDENAQGYQGEMRGEIRFENVSLSYGEGDTLKDISFDVLPGQTVAIVGQTGSGKSSLAKLINRTYDVRSADGKPNGRVLVDGIDVRDWNMAALRRQTSIIEQDIFLFSRTIAENIAFGQPGAARATIIEAAKAAQAHEFILGFQDGYDTIIGERGVNLSGGQRQRLALARAFLTDPRILILDDSTSAVDSATEDHIQKAIQRATLNRTTLLITHRLSQIRWADVVLVLRAGELAACGNHETLMRNTPAYRRIFEQYEQTTEQNEAAEAGRHRLE